MVHRNFHESAEDNQNHLAPRLNPLAVQNQEIDYHLENATGMHQSFGLRLLSFSTTLRYLKRLTKSIDIYWPLLKNRTHILKSCRKFPNHVLKAFELRTNLTIDRVYISSFRAEVGKSSHQDHPAMKSDS